MNEDIVVRGKFWLLFDNIPNSVKFHRTHGERMQNPVALFFPSHAVKRDSSFPRLISSDLPENLHLGSYEKYDDKSLLIRIGHLFAEGESTENSVPVTVNLQDVFGVELIEELSLSGNQPLRKMKLLAWNNSNRNPRSSVEKGSTVRVPPMEIRTYLAKPITSPQSKDIIQ